MLLVRSSLAKNSSIPFWIGPKRTKTKPSVEERRGQGGRKPKHHQDINLQSSYHNCRSRCM
eukprot:scaffold5321_cov126-Cylindrotheca_fusiformis.AAC.3